VIVEKKAVKKRKQSKMDMSSDGSDDEFMPTKGAKPLPVQLLANNNSERIIIMDKFLKKNFDVDLDRCTVIRRTELGSIVHLFSHIRKTYHMEYLTIDDGMEDVEETDELQWVTRDELAVAAIPTGLKKGIKLMENLTAKASVVSDKKAKVRHKGMARKLCPPLLTFNSQSNPRKKVKVEEDPAAGTRGIMSFFQKQK
jgi:hypothetical protein